MGYETALVLGIAAVSLYAVYQYQYKQLDKKIPPGPPRAPIIGNLFQVPSRKPYLQFRKWAQEYGPVYSLRLGGSTVIVLNTAEAAHEILDNRAKTYSSRTPPHVAHDIMSDGQRFVLLPYEKEWKAAKKTIQTIFNTTTVKGMRPTQELESRIVLWDLMQHGEHSLSTKYDSMKEEEAPETHWFAIPRRYTTSVAMTAIYGIRVNRFVNNPNLHKVYEIMSNFAMQAQPGKYLADSFPVVRKLPDFLAPWRDAARKLHDWEMGLYGGLVDLCKSDLLAGKEHVTNYVTTYLRQRLEAGIQDAPGKGVREDGHLTDKLLAYTAGTILEGGSDTSATTMQNFLMFMASHPHFLHKCVEEIDAVVGEDRMPDFEDEFKLPYLRACIKETLRRRPPTIMGIAHSSDEDDYYEGYLIPKNSQVIGNVWTIHMDPKTYTNPFAFNPERFLQKDEEKNTWASGPNYKDRVHYVFGWGRRFCPGHDIAEASLFIVLSRILWAFNLKTRKDSVTGADILPDMNDESSFTDGFVSIPKIYPLAFIPRTEKKAAMIRKAFTDAQDQWELLGMDPDER
ncbi:hypothetical protein E1B28_002385 [Marasmius oreades]|uniref:Cytochrome P450 n=1 Tax=Marasmius oreades TaxID=181124 RepID=A0A9P7UN17_9AGAR|nr:uncharacterized protein E1B28_002385 [Marasmius oreades]KAG7086431.1 hypothetical protein E1B28_002385 [Marasmius oreades]